MRLLKPAVFLAAFLPALLLARGALTGDLGANPIDAITDVTGTWTLRFLLLTLAVTPVRRLTGWNEVIKLRRMLGLFAFYYGTLHVSTFVVLDHFFDFNRILLDLSRRRFITAGATGFLLMVPLALTSTTGWIRRLGGPRWQRLHRLAYVSAAAGVVHYLWLVKSDRTRPLRYGVVLVVLLAIRVWFVLRKRGATPRRPVLSAEA